MGIGGAAYYFANQAFTQRLMAESQEYSLSVQNKVSLFLRQRLGDIQVMSQLDIFSDSRQRTESTPQQKQASLNRFLEAYGAYDSIAVTDLEGNVIAQTVGEKLPNSRQRNYFQSVLKADAPIISQPEAGTLTKVVSIYVVAPIRDSVTGKPVGIVQARIPGDSFRMAVLSEEVQRRNAKIYLIDGNDRLFVTPEGVGAAAVDAQGRSVTNEKGETQAIDARSLFPNYRQLQNGAKATTDLTGDQLLTFAPIEDLRDIPVLNWKLIITEDKAIAFAAQNQLLLTLQVGIGLVIVLAGAIAAIAANRTIAPILAATNAVAQIGQGDLNARLNVQGDDEIAVLGSNINRMASQLQRSLGARAFEAAQEQILTAAKGSGALREADLKPLFDQAVEATRVLFNFDRVVIYCFDVNDSNGVVSESVNVGCSSAIKQQISDSCIPQHRREAYLNGYVAVIDDVSKTGLHREHAMLLNRLAVRSSLIVPIVGSARLFGLLIAHSCFTLHSWQEFEVDFFKRLGTELGLSAYRVRLLEETEKLAEGQRQLKEKIQQRALELLQEVEPIGKGDLTIRARVTIDEIGTIADSYNATVDSLRQLVFQVKAAVNQVVSNTHRNEILIKNLSTAAAQQAEESVTALKRVEEVVAAVRDVTTNAKQTEQVMQQAGQTVEAGDTLMRQVLKGIQTIWETVTETANQVKHLESSSREISTAVNLIRDVAVQTNQLALNVSLEANRGTGNVGGLKFIAKEVTELAGQSAGAAEEIQRLVTSIQTDTNAVVTAMKTGTKQMVLGTRLVDETRQSFSQITTASLQINQLVQAITRATMVQSQASETIAQTVADIAAIAQEASTSTDQVSSSFEELRRVAQLLQQEVEQFKVG
jgi:methyl-accepting chemotaxis protein